MPARDIIVIGASAGGVEALSALVRGLPPDLPAAVFICLHVAPFGVSALPAILNRAKTLPACHPGDGDSIEHGRIYVAPSDRHLLVRDGRVHLSHGPSENGVRPAVDPLFRSAARVYGERVAAVILSGVLDDGTAGLMAVKGFGGVCVVQDPDEALYSGMPRSAVDHADPDFVLPLAEIAGCLTTLARQATETGGRGERPAELVAEAVAADEDLAIRSPNQRSGTPSGFTCPECHGALWELHEGELIRYRCRVGHAYSAASLLAEQSEALDSAMWSAYRALRESHLLAHKLAERSRVRGHDLAVQRFTEQARDAEQRADLVRAALLRGKVKAAGDARITEDALHELEELDRHGPSTG